MLTAYMNRGGFGQGREVVGGGGGGRWWGRWWGWGTVGCHKRSGLRPPETTAPTADDFAQKHNRIIAAMGQLESLSGMCCKS